MGFFSEGGFSDILDPGGIFTGREGIEAAEQSADIRNQELLRQFEITQENLQPALRAAQRQLPGIEQQLDPSQFGGVLGSIRGGLDEFLDPTRARRGQVGADQLRLAGLDPSMGAISDLSRIDPSTFTNLLLGAESDIFGNRLALSGLGQGAGGVLSQLGQRTGAGIAESNIQAAQQAAAAQAQGQQNLGTAGGLAVGLLSDERTKDDIKVIGWWKGLRIISWKWKDWVPESWRNTFSAGKNTTRI